jgi:cytochrome c5
MKRPIQMRLILAVSTVLTTTLLFAQSPKAFKPAEAAAKKTTKTESTKSSDPGQQKFQANCGRCHSEPEQLSPSITGTVIRHMRVRASLSAQDEKDILRFMAP